MIVWGVGLSRGSGRAALDVHRFERAANDAAGLGGRALMIVFGSFLHSSLLGGCGQMRRGNDHNFCRLIGSVVVAAPAVLHAKKMNQTWPITQKRVTPIVLYLRHTQLFRISVSTGLSEELLTKTAACSVQRGGVFREMKLRGHYEKPFEILKRMANVNMIFVPYPGMAPVVSALLGRHVTSAFGNYGDLFQQVNAGKLRALATASRTRIKSLPDVPTLAKSGYSEYEADVWYGLVAPSNTPNDVISQLIEWTRRAIEMPEFKSKLAAEGIYPVGICGAEFAAFLRKRYDEYGRVIREADIKAE